MTQSQIQRLIKTQAEIDIRPKIGEESRNRTKKINKRQEVRARSMTCEVQKSQTTGKNWETESILNMESFSILKMLKQKSHDVNGRFYAISRSLIYIMSNTILRCPTLYILSPVGKNTPRS